MKPLSKKQKKTLSERYDALWGPRLMEFGWILVPLVIFERQRELGLDAGDVNILLHLFMNWAQDNGPPVLSKRAMAQKMGVDVSTVRRRLASLERRGLITREARFDPLTGQGANRYHLDGLVRAASLYAGVRKGAREGPKRPSPKTAPRPPDIDLVRGPRER